MPRKINVKMFAADLKRYDAQTVRMKYQLDERQFQLLVGQLKALKQPPPPQKPAPASRPKRPKKSNVMRFKHPTTDYVETIESPWVWVLIGGSIYFIIKGIWTHAVASMFLALVTCGLSWFIYPIFARDIVRAHYLKQGWTEL